MYFSEEKQIHEVFESISERYDIMNSVISFGLHKCLRKDVLKRIGLIKGTKAIDLCCGTGELTLALAREISPGEVYGIDFSENMLEKAREKVSKLKVKNVRFLYGNVKYLPFEDNYFHHATICFGLRNIPDYMETLKESWRVLKPGGKLVCLETSRPSLAVFKQIYFFYLRYLVPCLGGLFTGKSREYLWLQESTWSFPDKKTLAERFREAGFENIIIKQYLGGAAAMHIGMKMENRSQFYA